MSRTIIKTTYKDLQITNKNIERVLLANNYKNINENNENVWKCGNGFWTAMKYIKIEFAESNSVILSGWIRVTAGSEQNLDGFVAAFPKKQVLNVLQEIQMSIS